MVILLGVLFLLRIVLVILVFVLPYEAEIHPLKFCEELFWSVDWDYIESVDCFGQHGHFYYLNTTDP